MFPADLVTFTEGILNEKLHFFVQFWSAYVLLQKRKSIKKLGLELVPGPFLFIKN